MDGETLEVEDLVKIGLGVSKAMVMKFVLHLKFIELFFMTRTQLTPKTIEKVTKSRAVIDEIVEKGEGEQWCCYYLKLLDYYNTHGAWYSGLWNKHRLW